jgi:hypothetical protein
MRVSLLWLEISAQPTYVLIDRCVDGASISVGISSKCRLPMALIPEILDVHGITECSQVMRPAPNKPLSKPH